MRNICIDNDHKLRNYFTGSPGPAVSYDSHRLALEVITLLSKEPSLSLTSMAARISVDRHTLTRALRTTWGTSFRDLRCDVLVKEAIELLRDRPALCLKEIAFMTGFSSSKSFSHFIKRMTGLPPKQYRCTLTFRSGPKGF